MNDNHDQVGRFATGSALASSEGAHAVGRSGASAKDVAKAHEDAAAKHTAAAKHAVSDSMGEFHRDIAKEHVAIATNAKEAHGVIEGLKSSISEVETKLSTIAAKQVESKQKLQELHSKAHAEHQSKVAAISDDHAKTLAKIDAKYAAKRAKMEARRLSR